MREHTIAVLGRFDAGKTTFVKAVHNAATARPGPRAAEEAPTLGVIQYDVTLPDGQLLTFLDTPGFDGYQPGGEPAKETEEILQMLEDHLAANESRPVSHVLVFLNANDMVATEFKPRAQRAFERLFPNTQVTCITTRWDQVEDDDGPPTTAEEARSREESLYETGKTNGSLLEYLLVGRQNRGGDIRRFRSGLPNEAYSSPQDIVHKLFTQPGSDTTLEERLAAMTKERDDLAAKYALLLQEKKASTPAPATPGPKEALPLQEKQTWSPAPATPAPKEAIRAPRTRRQRLLDTIDKFSAQVLEMVAELDREALDIAEECTACRAEAEAASAAIKMAEGKLEEAKEDVKAAEEECTQLKQGQDSLAELERSLSAQLNGLEPSVGQRSVRVLPSAKQRIISSLKQTQALHKEREDWVSVADDYYQKGCQEVQQAGAEVEKWKRIEQGKERELNEWLFPEAERLSKDRESFRTLQGTLSTQLDAMKEGLRDTWEGTLGENSILLERLGGYDVDPEMVARPVDWAPVIDSFYKSQVTLALSQEMAKFHSAVLQRLKAQEDTAQREWKKGVEDIFGQGAPGQGALGFDQLPPLPPGPKDLPPPPPPLEGHTGVVLSVAFSWDGAKIVSGAGDGTARVWDALTGELQTVLEGHSTTVMSVAFSPDGKVVVSGSNDKTVRVWDVLGARVKSVLEGHSDHVWSVAVSPDGSRIVSGSGDRTARIWDASTGKVQHVLKGHTGIVSSVVFSGDGTRIFSGSHEKSVRVWDASTGEMRAVLQGHTDSVISVASSKDGLQIVSGSLDKTVRVWDVLTGKVLRVLEGHSSAIYAVAFSLDGPWICSGSVDSTMRVWDASTGTVQSTLTGHSGAIRSVEFSRDGRRIVSASYDKTIRVWDTTTPTSHGT